MVYWALTDLENLVNTVCAVRAVREALAGGRGGLRESVPAAWRSESPGEVGRDGAYHCVSQLKGEGEHACPAFLWVNGVRVLARVGYECVLGEDR